MLHFLAGLALCIFIGERLVHYISAWRLHRAVRRSLQWPPPERGFVASVAVPVILTVIALVVGAAILPGLMML